MCIEMVDYRMDLYHWWVEVEKGYFFLGERANGRLW